MSEGIVKYTVDRLKLINEQVKSCGDTERKNALLAIRTSIKKFFRYKLKLNAA